MAPILKESWELDLMRRAGRIVAEGVRIIERMARPGVSTADLDAAFERSLREAGAVPTFKGYRGFPAAVCASINEEVVHGIPSPRRILKEGDILSIDCGATYKGYVGDMAVTLAVGRVSDRARRLIEAARGALDEAVRVVGPNVRLSEVSRAIQRFAEERGFNVVRKFVGHGVGRDMHEEPQVPNFVEEGMPGGDFILKPGICLAIEPMLNEGTSEVVTLPDGWTVVTQDGKLSAHFEHTVAVTREGREVLTRF